MSNGSEQQRLIIVSNRLPFEVEVKDSIPIIHPGSGGLVTALAPVLQDRRGIWVGWPGGAAVDERAMRKAITDVETSSGFSFEPVFLTKEDIDLYYHGFSNDTIWPLFHDLQGRCSFIPEQWQRYQDVNDKFADTLISRVKMNHSFLWIHDYHLIPLGQALRQRGATAKMGFFLHIPFPPLDIFIKLPWRFQILQALLTYDLVGFQTHRDYHNFIQCLRLMKEDLDLTTSKGIHFCQWNGHETRIGAFPISIDFKDFSSMAGSQETAEAAWLLHEKWPDQKIVLSVDRLDYTKGITFRLEGIRRFLKQHPEWHGKICFIQLVVPSRVEIASYQTMKQEIERLVSEINGQFTLENWIPIHHLFRPLPKKDLLAYYRTSDAVLVTSIKDGMNLVAKEYVACQIDRTGVLILSEFAGAAAQLRNGALLINPYDVEGIADAINQAMTMPQEERYNRMKTLQRSVKRQDIYWWMRTFLSTAFAKTLDDFPVVKEESLDPLIPMAKPGG